MSEAFASRWYQQKAVDAVFDRWAAGDRGTALDMATGTGKTRVMAGIGGRIFDQGGRTLVVAHRDFLLDDGNGGGAYAAFRRERSTMQVCFEKNVDKLSDYDIASERPDVVMATVQSMHRRLEKYPKDFFTHIMFDEGHRAAASTYIKILRYFDQAKLLLVSATFKRSDGKTVKGHTSDAKKEEDYRTLTTISCEDVAFSFPMGVAVDDGWVCRPEPETVKVQVDWSKLKAGREFSAAELDELMNEDSALHEVANGLLQRVTGLHGIVFMPGVDSAIGLARLLREGYGVRAEVIHGKVEPHLKPDIIRRFKNHEFDWLVNVAVAIEGFDDPTIEFVGIARPTRNISTYLQMMGRGCRALDGVVDGWNTAEERKAAIAASDKPSYRLLDFEGNLGRLQKPVNGRDVLIGELPHHEYPDGQPRPTENDVRGVMDRRPELSIEQARQRASDELYEKEVILGWRSKATVEVKHVDIKQFNDFWSIPFVYNPKKHKPKKKPPPGFEPSEKQKRLLEHVYREAHGKPIDPDWLQSLDKRKCSGVIGSCKKRIEKRRAKQREVSGNERSAGERGAKVAHPKDAN